MTADNFESDHLLALLNQYRANLKQLLIQRALHGKANVPLSIINGIVLERENIARVKSQLRKQGITVPDKAIDDLNSTPDIDLSRFSDYARHRNSLIDQIKTFWVDGFLERSIYKKAITKR
jgi:hypothetical protein